MSGVKMPWWLEPGQERCPFCEDQVQFEALVYCADCDRPVCPACRVEQLACRNAICPECHAEAGAVR